VRILFAVLAVSAVAAATAGAASRGTIAVVATRGPVTPVCAIEVPCDGPAAGVRLVVRHSGTVVGRAITNEDGRARLAFLPGRYLVTASYGESVQPRVESASIQVRAGHITRLHFAFDTGIR
jgi:hypothetical protein